MSQTHKDKIVVIGAGNVGEAIAYTLMVRVQANDIVLIDVNEDKQREHPSISVREPAFLNRYGLDRVVMKNVQTHS